MSIKLEHANITVSDIDQTIRFLQTAFPEFQIRHDEGVGRERWVHVGTNDTYLALNQADSEQSDSRALYSPTPGFNHLAYVVDDAESLQQRLTAAGYSDVTVGNSHPHRKRIYFNDPDGNEWEFVEYLSDVPSERNDYQL